MLDDLDLSTLRTLLVVFDAGSFTEAARRVGLEQSTISYRIKLLRRALDDPLFIRSGGGVQPTPRCIAVVQQLRPILVALTALAEPGVFDPAAAHGQVVISCNHHERRALMPAAISRIRRDAPQLKVALYEAAVDGGRQLADNLVDIVLGPIAVAGEVFYRRQLFSDRYVCVMDPSNPLARGALTLDRYLIAEHLAVTHNGRWEALFMPVLHARGHDIAPAVTVSSHDAIGRLIAGSTLVATIPERLARDPKAGWAIRPFPVDVPIDIAMVWTERTHHSGLHAWVRQVLAETAAAMGTQSSAGARADHHER